MDTEPLSFIHEPVAVQYDSPPLLSKTPTCPTSFTWRGEVFVIEDLLQTWSDFRRRGKFARNMREEHLSTAAGRGSWGVGRFHFRVRVTGGRIFQLYYDRAPESVDDRSGHWMLLGERQESES